MPTVISPISPPDLANTRPVFPCRLDNFFGLKKYAIFFNVYFYKNNFNSKILKLIFNIIKN
jgi:hypothetical protein